MNNGPCNSMLVFFQNLYFLSWLFDWHIKVMYNVLLRRTRRSFRGGKTGKIAEKMWGFFRDFFNQNVLFVPLLLVWKSNKNYMIMSFLKKISSYIVRLWSIKKIRSWILLFWVELHFRFITLGRIILEFFSDHHSSRIWVVKLFVSWHRNFGKRFTISFLESHDRERRKLFRYLHNFSIRVTKFFVESKRWILEDSKNTLGSWKNKWENKKGFTKFLV